MPTSPVSWSAQWIASTVCGGLRTTAPAPYFRKPFTIDGAIQSAVLHITALGLYECEINGNVVGDHVFAPGWTDYSKRVYFQSHDVTSLLARGDNAIGVILGDGWYCGNVAWYGRQVYGERPQFLAQLEITTLDGTQKIISDASWKTIVGPILESDMIHGETYDARRELGAWSTGGYDDAAWQSAHLAADPKIVIERSSGPPVRRHEVIAVEHAAAKPAPNKNGALIFDFKQNLTGRLRIHVKGRAGASIELRHAEILNPDGSIYTENLRSAKATDYYTLKGDPNGETWEPRFTFHGFRYAEVHFGLPVFEATVRKLEAVVLHSDTPSTGAFRCSHPLLNQLQHNIVWGQKGNFLDVPTDCPQRDERLGWTGDAQAFVRTAAFNMDVRGFFHKWLQDARDAQDAEGCVPSVIPNPPRMDPFNTPPADGGPAWADAVLICPWTIYRCYGDIDILRDNYALMEGYMNYLAEHKVKDFIRNHPDFKLFSFGDWLALDGTSSWIGLTYLDLIGTAFYAYDADIMAQTAEVLCKKDDAKKYRELHRKIADAFARRYITPDGLIISSPQTAYVLALHFNLVPENIRAAAARELVRNIERNDYRLATGFVGTPYLLHVLESTGHLDVAYKLLEQEAFPSWLFPVKNGATTIWERWDGWTTEKGFQTKEMNSFNHYAYGAVGDWMVSTVAGLEIGAPGYKKILFKPRPGGTITSAEASLKTPQGEAGISWKLDNDGSLHLQLTVPEGSEATLSAPEGWTASATAFKPGTHSVTARQINPAARQRSSSL
jgi:alpha-L-rhamnosidase